MAMLTLNGIVQNVFHTPAAADRKTGEIRAAKNSVQLMCENVLQTGDKRFELVTLSTEHPEAFKKLLGRPVSVPVGVFAPGASVQFYALKGVAAPAAA